MHLIDNYAIGSQILDNISNFKYSLKETSPFNDSDFYKFSWSYSEQHGYIGIQIRRSDNKMSNSSMIGTDDDSPMKFSRPVGLYNDPSLAALFESMLDSISVIHNGIYSG